MFGDMMMMMIVIVMMMMMIVMMASKSGKRVYCNKILTEWVHEGGGKGESW